MFGFFLSSGFPALVSNRARDERVGGPLLLSLLMLASMRLEEIIATSSR